MEVNDTIQSLLGPLRAKRNPPEFKPRSRSLHDLPGGIRVPIIKARRQPRLKDKLQETMAGLEELELLRKMHQKLVIDAKVSGVCKDNKSFAESGTTHNFFSPSNLSDITEERISSIEEEEIQDESVQESPTYRDLYRPQETSLSKDTYDLSVKNMSVLINSSQELATTQTVSDNVKEIEEAVFDEEDISFSGSSDGPELYKSVNREGYIRNSADMQMRLRRSSFRCEAVLTHHKTNPRLFECASFICNYPSPMHAVLRQFSSVSCENVRDESRPVLKETAFEKGNYHLNKVIISPKITSTSNKNFVGNNTMVDYKNNHSGNMVVEPSLHKNSELSIIQKNETDKSQNKTSRHHRTLDGTSKECIPEELNKEFIREDNVWNLTPKQGKNMSRRSSLPAAIRPFSASLSSSNFPEPLSSSNLFRASNGGLSLFAKRFDTPNQTFQKNKKVQDNNDNSTACNLRSISECTVNDEVKCVIEAENDNSVNCPITLKSHRSFSEVHVCYPATTRLQKTLRQTAV